MTTNEVKDAIRNLDAVVVLNKYGDEVSAGRIVESLSTAIVLENGDCIPFRNIVEVCKNVLKLSVAV